MGREVALFDSRNSSTAITKRSLVASHLIYTIVDVINRLVQCPLEIVLVRSSPHSWAQKRSLFRGRVNKRRREDLTQGKQPTGSKYALLISDVSLNVVLCA